MLASNLLDIIDDIVYSNCCISINKIYNYRWLGGKSQSREYHGNNLPGMQKARAR